jgi:hypothetical protein
MIVSASTFDPAHVLRLQGKPLVGRFLSFREARVPSAELLLSSQPEELQVLDLSRWVDEQTGEAPVQTLASLPMRTWLQRSKATIPAAAVQQAADGYAREWLQLPLRRLSASMKREAIEEARKALLPKAFRSTKLFPLVLWPPEFDGQGNRGWLGGIRAPIPVLERRILKAFGVFCIDPLLWASDAPWGEALEDDDPLRGWKTVSVGSLNYALHHGVQLDLDVSIDGLSATLNGTTITTQSLATDSTRAGLSQVCQEGAASIAVKSLGFSVALSDGDTVGVDADELGVYRCRVPAGRGGLQEEILERRFRQASEAVHRIREVLTAILPQEMARLEKVAENAAYERRVEEASKA